MNEGTMNNVTLEQYHNDCIERLQNDFASYAVAELLAIELTENAHERTMFEDLYENDVCQYVCDRLHPLDEERFDLNAIIEYIYDRLHGFKESVKQQIVDDWSKLSYDERLNWYCGDGMFGFTEKYNITFTYSELNEILKRMDEATGDFEIENKIWNDLTEDTVDD